MAGFALDPSIVDPRASGRAARASVCSVVVGHDRRAAAPGSAIATLRVGAARRAAGRDDDRGRRDTRAVERVHAPRRDRLRRRGDRRATSLSVPRAPLRARRARDQGAGVRSRLSRRRRSPPAGAERSSGVRSDSWRYGRARSFRAMRSRTGSVGSRWRASRSKRRSRTRCRPIGRSTATTSSKGSTSRSCTPRSRPPSPTTGSRRSRAEACRLLGRGTISPRSRSRDDHPLSGERIAALYFWLFPATMVNVYPWGLSLNLVVPLAPDAHPGGVPVVRARSVAPRHGRRRGSPPGRDGGRSRRGLAAARHPVAALPSGRLAPAESAVAHFHEMLEGALR